jgi:hypothetical protein
MTFAPMAGMGGMMIPQMPTGMFGAGGGKPKMDIAGMLQGMIGGYLAGSGKPGGAAILGMVNQRQQARDDDARAQQDRENQFQDFVRKESWKAANPGAANNDTVADYNFWKGVLPPEQFEQYVANKVNPPQLMNIPGVGVVQVPRMGGGRMAAPTAPVGKLSPIDEGGPMPSASGGFPRPY